MSQDGTGRSSNIPAGQSTTACRKNCPAVKQEVLDRGVLDATSITWASTMACYCISDERQLLGDNLFTQLEYLKMARHRIFRRRKANFALAHPPPPELELRAAGDGRVEHHPVHPHFVRRHAVEEVQALFCVRHRPCDLRFAGFFNLLLMEAIGFLLLRYAGTTTSSKILEESEEHFACSSTNCESTTQY